MKITLSLLGIICPYLRRGEGGDVLRLFGNAGPVKCGGLLH